jgi:chromosome segregation ATPase
LEIEEHQDRLKILDEHLKSVQMELVHTQSLVDVKNKEIESEEHLKQVAERQSGRLKNEIEKLEQRVADQQDRLNNIQNMIFKANEKMDQFKLEMNWNQEELEQWALAARQKEEDNLTLEKYRRADEAKIKELTLNIEKLTIEVARKSKELEQEVTETQAAQIELDKTAEEFKRLHAERHQLYLQWQDTVDNSRKRDELINETGESYGSAKEFLDKKKVDLEDHKKKLDREKENNKELESNIAGEERQLTKIRESLAKFEEERNNLEGEVAILRNQLSAFATELSHKRINVSSLNQVLGERMQRLDAAKKKYQATKERLSSEKNAQDNLERANKMSENEYKESNNMLSEVDKEIRLQKETLFKESQTLFKLRAEQANLIGDISGTLSASRNLQANIIKLKQEQQRQQELLYNAEFQIQQMERKVSRASGERSQEETKRLQQEILEVQEELDRKKESL